jgi:hypothetical protein
MSLKKVIFSALSFVLFLIPSVCIAYTEVFYVCQNGNGSAPKGGKCSTAWSADDFSAVSNWDSDNQIDGKIGPNDRVVILDEGGRLNRSSGTGVLMVRGSGTRNYPIVIEGETGQIPIVDGQNSRTCLYAAQIDFITIRGIRFTLGNKYSIDVYNGDGWIIENCIADNAGGANIIVTGDGGIIRGCESYNARSGHGVYLTGDSGAVATNWTVEECYIYENAVHGIQINSEGGRNTGIITRYNWIEDNRSAGINELGSDGGAHFGNIIIYHDSFNNNTSGMYIDHDGLGYQPRNIKVYNNIFYGNFRYGINIDGNNSGHAIRNNIFYMTHSSGYLYLVDTPCTASFDYNQLYPAGWSGAIEYQRSIYNSLSAWQNGAGQDRNSDDADPLFENRHSDIFALKPDSPCIDAADNSIGYDYHVMLAPSVIKSEFGPYGRITKAEQNNNGPGWEIGPFVYITSDLAMKAPAAPTGLRIIYK